jgi:hypothetical protein
MKAEIVFIILMSVIALLLVLADKFDRYLGLPNYDHSERL